MRARVPPAEFHALDLEVHAILRDVPLRDVTVVDLPDGGDGRTISDVLALMGIGGDRRPTNPIVRGLFSLRGWLGRVLGWDDDRHRHPEASYLARVSGELQRRSVRTPGAMAGAFRTLYVLEREALLEARNRTVHAFLASALAPAARGYRLYLAVYVKPVSRLTPFYMALIEPFRRFVVYPDLVRRTRRAWDARYGR
ncbi:MAG: DUF2867 domain-containing protein [Candidatus Rokubacteria bacterium]|nr:DUF2867 domain-containing protein [Candidatus Rokubacteria bacterium]